MVLELHQQLYGRLADAHFSVNHVCEEGQAILLLAPVMLGKSDVNNAEPVRPADVWFPG